MNEMRISAIELLIMPASLPHHMFYLFPGNPNVMICGSENEEHVTFECELAEGVKDSLWSSILRFFESHGSWIMSSDMGHIFTPVYTTA